MLCVFLLGFGVCAYRGNNRSHLVIEKVSVVIAEERESTVHSLIYRNKRSFSVFDEQCLP